MGLLIAGDRWSEQAAWFLSARVGGAYLLGGRSLTYRFICG